MMLCAADNVVWPPIGIIPWGQLRLKIVFERKRKMKFFWMED
jgi:hypothetical protein